MRAGIQIFQFWDMTPAETIATINAELWRIEQSQKNDLSLAWMIAALSRSKRLPSLKQLLFTKPAIALEGIELEKRRQEFSDMTKNVDLTKIKRKNANTTG